MELVGAHATDVGDGFMLVPVGPFELIVPDLWHSMHVESYDNAWLSRATLFAGAGFVFEAFHGPYDDAIVEQLLAGMPLEPSRVEPCTANPGAVPFVGRRGIRDVPPAVCERYVAALPGPGLLSFGIVVERMPGGDVEIAELRDTVFGAAASVVEGALVRVGLGNPTP